ncbi:hypothetical protein CQY20_28425 [Mycolicibacterium agri]|uniref:Uncharacterized protein n=1 Tax=Mycolicibacterium agri TaxID=36811 RepID=A0A2A7MQX5_MYCAG|nr:hypothetical protein CQY20_28425 [Mycolicibacterium agri]GFG50172.1 hypothetical protein MAGR_16130 [Mycolicibacterium agri]
MSKTGRPNYRRGSRGSRKAHRHITVRSVRREPPDLRKLSRAVIAMAMREAEAEAEAKAARTGKTPDESLRDESPGESGTEAHHDR